MESLTDAIEEAAWRELEKIEKMGGVVAAIENGYLQREIAKSAHERQQKIERREELIVGVNCFTGESELEVTTSRLVDHPYDPARRGQAEAHQKARLAEVKRKRNSREVGQVLQALKAAAQKEEVNLMPYFIDCVKAYATEQKICDVLREVFGEYEPPPLL